LKNSDKKLEKRFKDGKLDEFEGSFNLRKLERRNASV
jgi:hypothetical protein